MQGSGAGLSVLPNAQAGPSRPITFKLPPSPRITDFILPPSSGTTPPVTPPAFDRSNPFAASPSGSSFLGRLSRKLSIGKSSLTRRDSSRSKTSETNMGRNVTFAPATTTTSRTESPAPTPALDPASGSHGPPTGPTPTGRKGSGALRLRRSLRVSGVKGLRRARSEGNAAGPPRRIVAVTGETSEVQLTRSATGGKLPARTGQAGLREHPQQAATDVTEVHSHLGSYYWSDTLGVCWDGRERVTPDPLFTKEQQYTSDADFIPTVMQQQATRVVYASTLSSFPPRPPLKPRAPELSPAAQIIADYRAQHGTLTPSVRSFRLDAPESVAEASPDAASTLEPPTPRRLHLDTEVLTQQDCTESPASSRSSTSQAARKRFAHADPAEQISPTDTLAAGGESDTSAEDEAVAPSSLAVVERGLTVPAPKQA